MPRKDIFVRPARKEDCENFVAWTSSTKDNLSDPAVLEYPSTVVDCAFDRTGPLVYMPRQTAMFLESLAVRPGLDALTTAAAMRELTRNAVSRAYSAGMGELYFVCDEPGTKAMAERHGFQKLDWDVLRLRLAKLEGK